MTSLKTIFASVLGISESDIRHETSPENTPSWDSLNAIVLVTEIEKAYGIRFTYEEVMTVSRYEDAVALVRLKGGRIEDDCAE